MKKRTILIAGGLAVILVIAFVGYRLIGSLDEIIEAGIEKFGSEITGADVALDDVVLDLANGQASLHGLTIGNPQGFQTSHLLKAGEIKLVIDVNTLTGDPINIREILVESPDVIYEMAGGTNNVDALLANVRAYTGGGSGESDAAGQGSGPGLVIDDIYINNGKVSLSHEVLKGKTMEAGLPDIHLEDIGKDEGGASPGEVAREIMAALKSGATTAVASINNLPGVIGDQLGNVKDLGGSIKDKLGEAGEKLKGLFGN